MFIIPYGTTVFTIITPSLQHTALVINQDALTTTIGDALVPIRSQDMAHSCEGIPHSMRNRPFECDLPAAQNAIARGFDPLLYVHSKVNHIDRHLNVALRLHISTHDPVTQPWLLVFQDQRWNNSVQGPLARGEDVRMCRLSHKARATIVQTDAGVSGHNA